MEISFSPPTCFARRGTGKVGPSLARDAIPTDWLGRNKSPRAYQRGFGSNDRQTQRVTTARTQNPKQDRKQTAKERHRPNFQGRGASRLEGEPKKEIQVLPLFCSLDSRCASEMDRGIPKSKMWLDREEYGSTWTCIYARTALISS